MKENGNVELSEEPSMWDVTIIDNEITLLSNRFYLDVTKRRTRENIEIGEELVGNKYMIIWKFIMYKKYYMFFIHKKEKKIYYLQKIIF